jgi:hypothetical protein
MRTAKNLSAGRFHPVTDDFAVAMSTFRRDHRDGALEAVKDVGLALRRDLKGFVVFVSAQFAFSHHTLFRSQAGMRAAFLYSARWS